MNLRPFKGPGSLPSRRQFWHAARDAVVALQKVAGRNVTVSEHLGKGTVINVAETSARRRRTDGGGGPPVGATGACCLDGDCSITTIAQCDEIGGSYQGDDTTCEDVDCGMATSGACCVETDCTIQTPFDCAGLGGTYQGDDTTCDPNPCVTGACCVEGVCSEVTEEACSEAGGTYLADATECLELTCACPCGFEAFDGSGRVFLRYSATVSGNRSLVEVNDCPPPDGFTYTVDETDSESYEAHYESDGMGGCIFVIDTNTASSTRVEVLNGTTINNCSSSDPDQSCFCIVGWEFSACDTYADFCTACATIPPGTTMDTTTTTRLIDTNFDNDCSVITLACAGGHHVSCTVTGSGSSTETLSDECIPI